MKLTWKKLIAHDVKFLEFNDDRNYIGEEEAGKYIDSYFNMEDLKLKFEQLYVDVSDDFTLGYTIGKFTVRFKKDGKLKTITERYILVWKKYNGEWKIAINM
jgi:ketosteroid isomerase-like protein